MPDGKIVDGKSWETTPLQIALEISKGLADNAVISKVNDEVKKFFFIIPQISGVGFRSSLRKRLYLKSFKV